MAKVKSKYPVQTISGKVSRKDDGYYYTTASGEQFYRKRDESYHKIRSPKQCWLGLSFAYAHSEMQKRFSTPEQIAQMTASWKNAHKIGTNGKVTKTAHSWQFAELQLEWQVAHPYEQWYANYIQSIADKATAKATSGHASNYMINQKIQELQAQIDELKKQLKA